MLVDELKERLYAISLSDDGTAQFDELCAELITENAGLEAVDVIIDFLEWNDDRSLCCGGGFSAKIPLMHFAERFSGQGYEQLLIASVERMPRLLTVHMLERATGRERDGTLRAALIETLEQAAANFVASDIVRECAARILAGFARSHGGLKYPL